MDKGLQVVEAIKSRDLRCDELVYNTLMERGMKSKGQGVLLNTSKSYKIEGFEANDVTKPYKFIGFGAMDVSKQF